METPNETAEWLAARDNFLILSHRRPDGDTIGCAAALCRGLRRIGKRAVILENPQITERYKPYFEGLTTDCAPEGAVIITVDIASEGLLPINGEEFTGRVDLSIDHHQSNERYAAETFLRPSDAACGEGLCEILTALCGGVDAELGAPLYMAIVTDCGCFKYSNTSSRTLRMAALLKDAGVDTYRINKIMFATKTMARLRLEAALADGLELRDGGRVGICILTRKLLADLQATEDDADDIAGFARNVAGVEIGVMIREQPDGTAKLSLRTGDQANASTICARLGGGGHRGAAGASLTCGVAEAREKIIAAIAAGE